jgi:hypothetical protein
LSLTNLRRDTRRLLSRSAMPAARRLRNDKQSVGHKTGA